MTPVREALDLLFQQAWLNACHTVACACGNVHQGYRGSVRPEIDPRGHHRQRSGDEHYIRAGLCFKKILDEMNRHVKLNEMPLERQLSREFHTAIAESLKDLLIKLYARLPMPFLTGCYMKRCSATLNCWQAVSLKTHDEHIAIMDALAKGDEDKAVQASIEQCHGFWQGGCRSISIFLRKC